MMKHIYLMKNRAIWGNGVTRSLSRWRGTKKNQRVNDEAHIYLMKNKAIWGKGVSRLLSRCRGTKNNQRVNDEAHIYLIKKNKAIWGKGVSRLLSRCQGTKKNQRVSRGFYGESNPISFFNFHKVSLRQQPSVDSFKSNLKTLLFPEQ